MNSSIRFVILALVTTSGFACASSDTSSPTISVIDLSPSPCVVTKTNSTQLSAVATLPNGTKKDITSANGIVWTTGNSQTITVSQTGNIVGVNAGITEIAASYQGAKGTMSCTVP